MVSAQNKYQVKFRIICEHFFGKFYFRVRFGKKIFVLKDFLGLKFFKG